jgi:hypothetical protein
VQSDTGGNLDKQVPPYEELDHTPNCVARSTDNITGNGLNPDGL